jgi:hypothetical protein
MHLSRRQFGRGVAALSAAALMGGTAKAAEPTHILRAWYSLILELVRQTPTYSPPVAARAFAYLGITTFEAVASGSKSLKSLAGQARGLANVPQRQAGVTYDDAVIVHAALATGSQIFFGNTGPSGLRAMKALEKKLHKEAAQGLDQAVWEASAAYGKAVAQHIDTWSKDDGGAHVEADGRTGPLGANKYHCPAAEAASAEVGRLPAHCHAAEWVLSLAAAARLQ